MLRVSNPKALFQGSGEPMHFLAEPQLNLMEITLNEKGLHKLICLQA